MITNPILPNYLNGRDIFTKVIPTVNSLSNLLKRLDELEWDYRLLKGWEKPIYRSFHLDHIKSKLKVSDFKIRISLIKEHILSLHPGILGAHPVCIYLVAYYSTVDKSAYDSFESFIVSQGISKEKGSAQAIWSVGTTCGKYLGLFDKHMNIIDWGFFEKWANIENGLTKDDIYPKSKINSTVEVKTSLIFNESKNHLDFFLNTKEETRLFMGTNPLAWSKFVLGKDNDITIVLDKKIYRDELLSFCADKSNTDLETLLAILSWGGMNREHGKKLLANPETILDITNKLRGNYFTSRKEAFFYIQQKRKQKLLPGLGIGYFTKLICFLAPQLNGYIMDQWVAKAINLITSENIVDISKDGWITDKNNESDYEQFCAEVDNIAALLQITGYKAEERLFSIGGIKKGEWRQYVIDNYNKI